MADDVISQPRRGRNWMRWGWFGSAILLPAVFAGLFSLIPNLFDRLMAPRAKLEYHIVSSPSINTAGSHRSIYSIALVNAGGAKLTDIVALVSVPRGVVEQANLDTTGGEQPQLIRAPTTARVTIKSMFPRERSTAVFLITTPAPGIRPVVSVRSAETMGIVSEPTQEKEQVPFWFALFPAFGVVMGAMLAILLRRSRIASSAGLGRPGVLGGITRPDVIGLVATYVDLPELDQALVFQMSDVTYIRFAEILLRTAKKRDEAVRNRCISALKALILSPFMHERALAIVENNLQILQPGVDCALLHEKRKSIQDIQEYRREVRNLFADA